MCNYTIARLMNFINQPQSEQCSALERIWAYISLAQPLNPWDGSEWKKTTI